MKIAIAQINPIVADIDGNQAIIASYVERAKKTEADIVVFPEMATIGYPPMDLLQNRKLINDNLCSIENIARLSQGIAIICGYVEYDMDNPPLLYNAAAYMAHGAIASRHYKSLLPSYDVFDEQRYFSQSREQKPAIHDGRSVGITICEDIWNDSDFDTTVYKDYRRYTTDPVSRLSSAGIDLLVNISASPYVRGKNSFKWKMVSSIAKKHSVPVVYVNQVGGNDSLIFDGRSFCVNRKGEIIATGSGFSEDLVVVDIDGDRPPLHPAENEEGDILNALILGLKDYVLKCGFKKVVLGLSGGIDSALTATIATMALGQENVMGITMPSMFSSSGSIDDSLSLAGHLGIRIETIPIREPYHMYLRLLAPVFEGRPMDVAEENIQARIRGNLLMAVSNKYGSLLLTTGNKSELAMGYCTLYGDMSGGLAVISDLPKTLVYRIAEYINREKEIIPWNSIRKPPSAELRENQKDEDSLPPYSLLDAILECYIEKLMTAEEIVQQGYPAEIVKEVLVKVDRNEYKRRQAPPGLKVTSKAFGIGRRIPIAQRFKP
jgi:NAD+ synthase (glutamine-hydrolysing)